MRKVIFLKWIVSNYKKWIFMRLIWILFSLKSGPYLIQFCLTWSLPSTFNKKWICVRLESSNQYVWKDLKARAVCDAVCKTHNHYASHNDCSHGQRLRRLGFLFSKKVPFGFEVWTCQKGREVPDRILKLIVLSLGLIQIVNEAKNKFKKIIKFSYRFIMEYPI